MQEVENDFQLAQREKKNILKEIKDMTESIKGVESQRQLNSRLESQKMILQKKFDDVQALNLTLDKQSETLMVFLFFTFELRTLYPYN